jgi:hypothetical protein
MRRREVLAGLGAAAVGSGTAAANHAPDGEYAATQPAHVTIDFDRAALERYRPALDLGGNDRSRFQGFYAWRATSPEYDLDWHVYWAYWTHQTGVTEYDSHLGDREPCYVGIDPSDGSVQAIVFSAYHWLRGTASAPSIPLTDGKHPALQVVAPWHHYTLGQPGTGVLPDVQDLAASDGLSAWLANGLDEDLLPGSCHDPRRMWAREPDWWRNDLSGDLTAFQLSILRQLGAHRDGGIL